MQYLIHTDHQKPILRYYSLSDIFTRAPYITDALVQVRVACTVKGLPHHLERSQPD